MKKFLTTLTLIAMTATASAFLVASPATAAPPLTTFEVTITNVSAFGLLDTDRAGGTVPLSPGVYAVAAGAANPMFRNGKAATDGIEDIAEDGNTAELVAQVEANKRVSDSGTFETSDGPIAPALFTGTSATFTVSAKPGDRLYLATMFVQSNDFFFADDGHGIKLFNGTTPISGDITGDIDLWDAGTEADTAPGTGPDQKPVQLSDDQGPSENSVVLLASQTGDGFDLPSDAAVIQVTITPVG